MAKLTLMEEVRRAIAAACSGLWINSYEHQDAAMEIGKACKAQGWRLMTWDPEVGLKKPNEQKQQGAAETTVASPIAAIQALRQEVPGESRVVLLMRNIHPFLATPDGRILQPNLLQAMQSAIEKGQSTGHHILVLAHDHVKIPAEMEKLMYVIDHQLPTPAEIYELWKTVEEDEDVIPEADTPEAKKVLDAACGLTRIEVVNAMSMSATSDTQTVTPDVLWDFKAKALMKTGALELLTASQLAENFEPAGFSQLGGMNALKEFCLQMFNSPKLSKKIRPLGVTLVGPPGGGKSAFAKALGLEVGWTTVRLDVGALMGSYVGETEANTRRALKTVDAMEPSVLMIDEVEKALSGTGSGEHDSGVGTRLLGSILTWMNDHRSRVFVIFTANDVTKLPPELFRAERIDGIFMLDMPGREQKDAVWAIYQPFFELEEWQIAELPDDENWMPAEIKTCCRQAAMRNLTLKQAATQIVPTYNTNKERIAALKAWAHGRCLSAEYRGLYDQNGEPKFLRPEEILSRPKRRVTRTK